MTPKPTPVKHDDETFADMEVPSGLYAMGFVASWDAEHEDEHGRVPGEDLGQPGRAPYPGITRIAVAERTLGVPSGIARPARSEG
jgi:hypothetical protein